MTVEKCSCCGQVLNRETRVIKILKVKKRMTLTELSSVTGISKSNLNQILNKLQKNKQIKRYRKMDSRIILREKIIEFRNDEPQVTE